MPVPLGTAGSARACVGCLRAAKRRRLLSASKYSRHSGGPQWMLSHGAQPQPERLCPGSYQGACYSRDTWSTLGLGNISPQLYFPSQGSFQALLGSRAIAGSAHHLFQALLNGPRGSLREYRGRNGSAQHPGDAWRSGRIQPRAKGAVLTHGIRHRRIHTLRQCISRCWGSVSFGHGPCKFRKGHSFSPGASSHRHPRVHAAAESIPGGFPPSRREHGVILGARHQLLGALTHALKRGGGLTPLG